MRSFDYLLHVIKEHRPPLTHLNDITDHQVPDLYLRRLTAPDDAEGLLALNAVLEAAELLLLGPVVEGGHEHDDDDRDEDGGALDPRGVLVLLDCNGCNRNVFNQEYRGICSMAHGMMVRSHSIVLHSKHLSANGSIRLLVQFSLDKTAKPSSGLPCSQF